MPDNSENYLFKVPKSNSARQGLGSLQNAWRNAQLMQMNTQEREKQKEENYRKILENYYQFLTSFGEVGINQNPKKISYGYNVFTIYWDIKDDLRTVAERGIYPDERKKLTNKLRQLKYLLPHDFIYHLGIGQNQMTLISDGLDWIAENKLNGYEQTDGEENEIYLIQEFVYLNLNLQNGNNATLLKKEMIGLLPVEQRNKIMAILTKEFEETIERDEFRQLELKKPENLAILKNIVKLFCRTQVFRGILSLIHRLFNLKRLEFATLGLPINTNKNPILKSLEKELMEKVGRLNILMQKFPEKFDNYEIFLASFAKDFDLETKDKNGEILNGEELLDQMRMELTESYRQIMDDSITERIARKILAEKTKLEVN